MKFSVSIVYWLSCDCNSGYSEPPDIRNWFSSYVYESPLSDTSSLYKESVPQGAECEQEGFAFEERNVDEGRCEHVKTKASVQHDSSFENNMMGEQSSSKVFFLISFKISLVLLKWE